MAKGIMLHEVGEQVDCYLLIKSSTKGIASNGKPFLTLMLQDQSGDIEAKLWDAKQHDETIYGPQTIVKVVGDIHHYRGRNQLKLRNIRPAAEHENVKIDDFLETAPIPKNEMMETITQYIFEMKNPNIQRITRHLVKKYGKERNSSIFRRRRKITMSLCLDWLIMSCQCSISPKRSPIYIRLLTAISCMQASSCTILGR